MKKIYILLMHTGTIPSKFVKFFTRHSYSHVAISLTKDCTITYSFGRRSLRNILNGGFSIQKKDGPFFEKFNNTTCKIYEIEIDDIKYQKVEEIINKMQNNINDYKYDFLGIVPRFIGIPIKFKNRFVCSHFVADVLQRTKVFNFNKKSCMVTPKDFEKIQEFKEIYKGKYLEYI